jgi:hypothetical protein
MALYNEILAGRYNRFLQKLFSMKGEPPSPQLGGEIAPAFPLFSGAENRYLESWQRFGLAVDTALAAAGNRPAVRIRNPVGSNVVAVIERIIVWSIVAATDAYLFYNAVATVLPTENAANLTGTQIDVRGGQIGSTAILSTSINFGLLGTNPIAHVPLTAGTGIFDFIITDIHEMPMAPGSEYTVVPTTFASELVVSILWRERFLEESERT